MPEDKRNKKEKRKSRVFTVPFSLDEFPSNKFDYSNNPIKSSTKEIIQKALKFHSQGKISEAKKYYKYCINQGIKDSILFNNYTLILRNEEKLEEAEQLQRKAIENKPDFAEAHFNLGNILNDLGKTKEAEFYLRKAISLKRNYGEAYFNLGNILKNNGNFKEAEKYIRKSIEIIPDFENSHNNLGIIMKALGNLKEAEESQRKAIKLKPDFALAHYNLGNTLKELGKLKEAELSTLKAIKIKPDFAQAYFNLGNIFQESGKLKESIKAYKKSLEINPNQIHYIGSLISALSRLASWDEIDNYCSRLDKIGIDGNPINPMDLMYIEDNPLNDFKRAINFHNVNKRSELKKINYKKKDKIHIGYFSSDFRNHVISHLITRILELHDKTKFKIFAYSLSNIYDDYTKRVKESISCFRKVNNLSDLEIVHLARKDKIDIAIDLNGYSKNNRSSLFSYRVAPIQINYLGYAGTLGSRSYDYILADKVIIPEENKKFYTEKVLYLPNSFLPHDDGRKLSSKQFSREELGLPQDCFIFTCFNNIRKITRKEFEIWIRLLKRIDKSILWMIKPNNYAIENIQTEITNNGLEKNRIIFAEKMNQFDHLSRHKCGDLFLDTFNYNASCTATDALWSGMPLITKTGKSFRARIATSILSACNLNELITANDSDYESLAYELATNQEKFHSIREKVKNKLNCSFFDSSKFTSALETIYIDKINNSSLS